MRYAATASLLAALATATPFALYGPLAGDGAPIAPLGIYVPAVPLTTAIPTPTPRTVYLAPDGTVLTSATGANRKLTAQENAVVGTPTWLVPTPTATPKMDCPAGFVCMTNNTDVDMRVTLDVGPTPTATATPKEK